MLMLLLAVEEPSRWDVGTQRTAAILGIILTILGIIIAYFKLKNQHKATLVERETAAVERAEQKKLLESVAAEFRPNHGSSMVDRQIRIEEAVNSHTKEAKVWFAANDEAHEDIKTSHAEAVTDLNRRVDGLYEIMLGGNCTTPRKVAARHQNREEPQ